MVEGSQNTSSVGVSSATTVSLGGFMSQVYAWMTAGLFITALVSYVIVANPQLLLWILINDWAIALIFVLELVLVVVLSGMIHKLNAFVAASLFVLYAILNGLFFGVLVSIYTESSVFMAFSATAGTFLIMSVYGAVTKADLTKIGNLAIMGLFGLIFGILLNLFFQSEGVSWVLTFLGIGIFIVLIAYDTQRLKKFAERAEVDGSSFKYAILGALTLYLDFINLFIRLLRLFGRRR